MLVDIDKSIIIGKNQLLEGEVNINFTKKNSIPIYRRPSGGGAIYADNGCFMYYDKRYVCAANQHAGQ